jgi:hypothetical protein
MNAIYLHCYAIGSNEVKCSFAGSNAQSHFPPFAFSFQDSRGSDAPRVGSQGVKCSFAFSFAWGQTLNRVGSQAHSPAPTQNSEGWRAEF